MTTKLNWKRYGLGFLAAILVVLVSAAIYGLIAPDSSGLIKVVHDSPRPVLIKNVRVFDGRNSSLTDYAGVLIHKDVIQKLFAHDIPDSVLEDNPGAFVLDARNQILSPAFIDAHAHFGMSSGRPPWDSSPFSLYPVSYEFEAYLYAGITSVVAAGPILSSPFGLPAIGPHVYQTGKIITARNGHPIPMIDSIMPWPLNMIAKRQMTLQLDPIQPDYSKVDNLLRTRPHHLKIVVDGAIPEGSPKLSGDVVEEIIRRSHHSGIPVYAHTAHSNDLRVAAEAGANILMHTPYQAAISPESLRVLRDTQTPVVSTSQIWEWALRGFSKNPPFTALERHLMSDETYASLMGDWSTRIESFQNPGFGPEYIRETIPRFATNLRHNLKAIHAAGGVILAGTDYGLPGLTPGASLIRELHKLKAFGFTNLEVLRMATSIPGRYLQPDGPELGVIREGAMAELILLTTNPLKELSAIDKVSMVFSQGRVYSRVSQPSILKE